MANAGATSRHMDARVSVYTGPMTGHVAAGMRVFKSSSAAFMLVKAASYEGRAASLGGGRLLNSAMPSARHRG